VHRLWGTMIMYFIFSQFAENRKKLRRELTNP